MKIEINEYIVADNEVCHGKPVFKGTRIMVSIILEMLKEGASTDEILRAYPSLTEAHIKAALEFAVNLAKQNRIST
jgi:uncharacterized protein (DUF433 family)